MLLLKWLKSIKSMSSRKFLTFFLPLLLTIYVVTIAVIFSLRRDTYRLPVQQKQTMKWCKSLKPKERGEPPVVLVSFSGSGNTWLRYLLQQASGFYTGSLYGQAYMRTFGFPGEELIDGEALVVKTHQDVNDTKKKVPSIRSAVILMRNPRDTILSSFHYTYSVINKFALLESRTSNIYPYDQYVNPYNLMAPPSAFRPGNEDLEWPKIFSQGLKMWEMIYSDWLRNFEGPMHVVFFEQLVNDTRNVLRKTLEFLNVTVTEEDLNCALEHKDGLDAIYKRPKKYQHFDPFTNDMYEKLHSVNKRMLKLLAKKLTELQKTSET